MLVAHSEVAIRFLCAYVIRGRSNKNRAFSLQLYIRSSWNFASSIFWPVYKCGFKDIWIHRNLWSPSANKHSAGHLTGLTLTNHDETWMVSICSHFLTISRVSKDLTTGGRYFKNLHIITSYYYIITIFTKSLLYYSVTNNFANTCLLQNCIVFL